MKEGPQNTHSGESQNQLPGPLHALILKYEQESQPFLRVHRLIDILEWVVKWHSVVLISELLAQGQLSDRLKLTLARGLRSPSLGQWLDYCREASVLVESKKVPDRYAERLLESESIHHLVAFRNKYAHGATPSDSVCDADLAEYEPVIYELVEASTLRQSVLIVSTDQSFILAGDDRIPAAVDLGACRT